MLIQKESLSQECLDMTINEYLESIGSIKKEDKKDEDPLYVEQFFEKHLKNRFFIQRYSKGINYTSFNLLYNFRIEEDIVNGEKIRYDVYQIEERNYQSISISKAIWSFLSLSFLKETIYKKWIELNKQEFEIIKDKIETYYQIKENLEFFSDKILEFGDSPRKILYSTDSLSPNRFKIEDYSEEEKECIPIRKLFERLEEDFNQKKESNKSNIGKWFVLIVYDNDRRILFHLNNEKTLDRILLFENDIFLTKNIELGLNNLKVKEVINKDDIEIIENNFNLIVDLTKELIDYKLKERK